MASWDDFKGIVWETLSACGPWRMADLVKEVESRTGYQKNLDYHYYVKKYVEMYEQKNGVILEDRVVD